MNHTGSDMMDGNLSIWKREIEKLSKKMLIQE